METYLWKIAREELNKTNIVLYSNFLAKTYKVNFNKDYNKLWEWSVNNPKIFWKSIWEFTKVRGDLGNISLQESDIFFKNKFFPDASLNSRYSREEIVERVDYAEALKTHLISGDIGSLPQAAYRWVLDQAGVSLALSGARNIDEVRDSVFAANAKSYGEATLSLAESIHSKDYCPA